MRLEREMQRRDRIKPGDCMRDSKIGNASRLMLQCRMLIIVGARLSLRSTSFTCISLFFGHLRYDLSLSLCSDNMQVIDIVQARLVQALLHSYSGSLYREWGSFLPKVPMMRKFYTTSQRYYKRFPTRSAIKVFPYQGITPA